MFKYSPIYFLLSLVLMLALYLRFNGIVANPPGFYTDEASIGYNAYTILTSGKDEYGDSMPLFFRAFGEYKTPFAIYPVVITESIFGANEFSVRATQGFLGVVVVFAVFLLAKEFWGKWIGLICALVITISPWAVHLSRFNIESHNAFLALVILGTFFFLRALKNERGKPLVLGTVFFGLSFYTYFATRVFTPIYLILLLWFFHKELKALWGKITKRIILSVLVFGFLIFPFALHMAQGKGFARYNQVSLKVQGQTYGQLLTKTAALYIAHFDPRFVFFFGDSDFPGQTLVRHSVTGLGLMYKWQLPFFILGFAFLIFSKKHDRKFLLLMLVIFPLGSLVSNSLTPLATRSVIGVIPYSMIIGLGIGRSFGILKSPIWRIGIVAFILVIGGFYLNRFIGLTGAYANRAYGYNGFQYGAKQIVQDFIRDQANYDFEVVYSGLDGADAYFKFFSLGKCAKCYYDDGRIWKGNLLFAVASDKVGEFEKKYNGELLRTIYYPDGREAFYVYRVKEAAAVF